MATPKEVLPGWNACEFLVSGFSWILMVITYNKAWLLVTHYEGTPEFQRGLDEDCFVDRNGTATCFNWGTGIRGRLSRPLEAIIEPSPWLYLSLYCARLLLFLIPVYLILPIYTKSRLGVRLGPRISGILTILIATSLLTINLIFVFNRFIPETVIDTIPSDYRLTFGWSYFLFDIGVLIPFIIGISQFYRDDYINLLPCFNKHESLPSSPPPY